jgi:hypothetical protein
MHMKKVIISMLCFSFVLLFAAQTIDLNRPTEKCFTPGRKIEAPANYPDFTPTRGWVSLISEDFESGMPAGWIVTDGNSDGYTWAVGTTADLGGYDPPNYGSAYAYYSDDDAGSGAPPGTEYLTAPPQSVNSMTVLTLMFGWGFQIYDDPFGSVYARFHDGGSWGAYVQLATYFVDANGIDTFDLTSYLPADSVQIEFRYEDPNAGWGWAFGVDNVELEGFVPTDDDVGVASIDSPIGTVLIGTVVDVLVTVQNFGNNAATFDVHAEIQDASQTVVWSGDTTGINLGAGNSQQIDFGT